MGPSSLFSSAPPIITADWPAQHAVFQPGHALDLVVHLAPDVDANGQPKFIQVTAEVRCTQVTEFHRTRAGNQPNETRRQEEILYSDKRTIWTPDIHHSFAPTNTPLSSTGTQAVDIPLRFQMPFLDLPPSFEGGTRGGYVQGHQVARVVYFVKLHGVKVATFSRDERHVLPFIFMPAPTFDAQMIPATLVMPGQTDYSETPPRQPSVSEGWATAALDHEYREKLFGKKSLLIVCLSAPAIPSVPLGDFLPFRLSLLLLTPPTKTSDPVTSSADFKSWSRTPPPALVDDLPKLSSIDLFLQRRVWAKAKGGSDTFFQRVGPATTFDQSRTWYSSAELVDMDEYRRRTGGAKECKPGEKRYGVEMVVVGEMCFGRGGTSGIGPAFGTNITRGLLECSYHLSMRVPLKGVPFSNFNLNPFMPITISPPSNPGSSTANQPPTTADLAPPDYFTATVGGVGYGWEDQKA